MTLEEIKAALDEALPLRSPRFDPDAAARTKVSELEDYMLHTARVNGNLVAARHWLRTLRADLADEWDRLQGWEVVITKPRGRLTTADIERAKISVNGALWEAIREARRLAESIDDQINRLEREERVCSRAYAMISGN